VKADLVPLCAAGGIFYADGFAGGCSVSMI